MYAQICSQNWSDNEKKFDLPFGNETKQQEWYDHQQLWEKGKRLNSQNLFVTIVQMYPKFNNLAQNIKETP